MSEKLNIDLREGVLEPPRPLSMHPQKFAMWLFIVSVVMIFAALTSAYIVRQAEGDFLVFSMPTIFYISTLVILLSSASIHWAYVAAKNDNLEQVKIGMAVTSILGLCFLVLQILGWQDLVAIDVYFVGNPGGSFVYVLSGLHGFHIVSGVIFLLVVLYRTFKYKVHSKNMATMDMCVTYWHFLDGLWVYLFVFLLLNN